MRKSVNVIKQLLDDCSEEDRDAWRGDAQTVLRAVRASHPSRRGVNGAIAAAFLESHALPAIAQHGWKRMPNSPSGISFSFALAKDDQTARVLIAMVQLEAGKPKRKYVPGRQEDLYVALLQKKSSRAVLVKPVPEREARETGMQLAENTRAYTFGDFDILTVSMQPVTRNWADFRYTLSAALVPRENHPSLIAQEQVVPLKPCGLWTHDLATCLAQFAGQTQLALRR